MKAPTMRNSRPHSVTLGPLEASLQRRLESGEYDNASEVLRTALRQAAAWPVGVRVAVNISPRQMAHDDLMETIQAALLESDQSGERLELEITENALLEYYAAAQKALKELKELGVRIAMDDFGTGFTSLSHLRDFPFDRIKIDRSFIREMTVSDQGGAVVRAVLGLAASLGIETAAEGVETRAQFEALAAYGCDEAQGFLFSAPRSADEITELLIGWSPASNAMLSTAAE